MTGLTRKFSVMRLDPASQRRHHTCRSFVLDLDHDPHALPAIEAYVASVADQEPKLAADLERIVEEVRGREADQGGEAEASRD